MQDYESRVEELERELERVKSERDQANVQLVAIRLAGHEPTAREEREACAAIAAQDNHHETAAKIRSRNQPASE